MTNRVARKADMEALDAAYARALVALDLGARLPDPDPERASRVAASRAAVDDFNRTSTLGITYVRPRTR
jgi:hypothetical protein